MRRAMNDIKENVNVRRESTQQRKLQGWCSLDEVIRAVESACGVPEKQARRKGMTVRRRNLPNGSIRLNIARA